MRTRVIPAQITTIEDKIAGSLNLTQILILMVPVFWTTAVYILFPPRLHLSWYKLPLTLIVLFLCLILSIRIKGKVVLNWLVILFSYNLRPKYYLFNKNEAYLRTLFLPTFETHKKVTKKVIKKTEAKTILPSFAVSDLAYAENLLSDPRYSISLKTKKKGELYVVVSEIK